MVNDKRFTKLMKDIGLIKEGMEIQIGKVYTDKDQPPFKTPHQITEEQEEGKMAKHDAMECSSDAKDVSEMITDDMDLPEWLEAKITKAADYMNDVKDYITHHLSMDKDND